MEDFIFLSYCYREPRQRMNPLPDNNSALSSEEPKAKPPKARLPSAKIAWAVTIAEGFLWFAALFAFSKYWIMLPVKYRVYGVTGLTLTGLVGILRIFLFYRKLKRLQRARIEPTGE